MRKLHQNILTWLPGKKNYVLKSLSNTFAGKEKPKHRFEPEASSKETYLIVGKKKNAARERKGGVGVVAWVWKMGKLSRRKQKVIRWVGRLLYGKNLIKNAIIKKKRKKRSYYCHGWYYCPFSSKSSILPFSFMHIAIFFHGYYYYLLFLLSISLRKNAPPFFFPLSSSHATFLPLFSLLFYFSNPPKSNFILFFLKWVRKLHMRQIREALFKASCSKILGRDNKKNEMKATLFDFLLWTVSCRDWEIDTIVDYKLQQTYVFPCKAE